MLQNEYNKGIDEARHQHKYMLLMDVRFCPGSGRLEQLSILL